MYMYYKLTHPGNRKHHLKVLVCLNLHHPLYLSKFLSQSQTHTYFVLRMLVPSFKPDYTLQYTSTGCLVKIPVMGSPLLLQVHALSPNEHRTWLTLPVWQEKNTGQVMSEKMASVPDIGSQCPHANLHPSLSVVYR